MNILNNPKIVDKTPVLTVFLLEGANVSQIHRMWSEQTANGQSLQGWIFVTIALILWANFYRVCCKDQKWAYYTTLFGIFINLLLVITVIYFRYIHHQ